MFETAKKKKKVTDYIISQIRDAVLSGQLKPGDRLASEKELIDQFEVSKATLREALRALEAMGLVETRKGASGGVYITEVNLQTTIHSMMNFLHFKSLSIREITMLRYMMEPFIVRVAVTRITAKEIKELQAYIDNVETDDTARMKNGIGFHRYLSRLTQNSMLILIIDFIESLLNEIKNLLQLDADFYAMVNDGHRNIMTYLVKGDAIGASRAMADDVILVGTYLSEKLGESAFVPKDCGISDHPAHPATPSGKMAAETPGGLEGIKSIASLNLDSEEMSEAKILKALGSADLYLIVPHSSDKITR